MQYMHIFINLCIYFLYIKVTFGFYCNFFYHARRLRRWATSGEKFCERRRWSMWSYNVYNLSIQHHILSSLHPIAVYLLSCSCSVRSVSCACTHHTYKYTLSFHIFRNVPLHGIPQRHRQQQITMGVFVHINRIFHLYKISRISFQHPWWCYCFSQCTSNTPIQGVEAALPREP